MKKSVFKVFSILIVSLFLFNCSEPIQYDVKSLKASLNETDPSELSYSELATNKVSPLFEEMIAQLVEFDKQTLPHEAKALRKLIGKTRAYLDIFSYAFTFDQEFDGWEWLRDDLDKGYEKMGLFKDIFDEMGIIIAVKDPETGKWSDGVKPKHIEYDEDEVKDARKKVLKWKDDFFYPMKNSFYNYYLKHTTFEIDLSRPKEVQSKFLWGGVDSLPNNSKSGFENVGNLVLQLTVLAEADYEYVKNLESLLDKEHEETFHDFRKRVRYVVKIIGYFPDILLENSTRTMDIIEQLTTMVSMFGDLNDRLISYHKAEKEDKKDKMRKIGKEVNKGLENLLEWIEENDVNNSLRELRTAILY